MNTTKGRLDAASFYAFSGIIFNGSGAAETWFGLEGAFRLDGIAMELCNVFNGPCASCGTSPSAMARSRNSRTTDVDEKRAGNVFRSSCSTKACKQPVPSRAFWGQDCRTEKRCPLISLIASRFLSIV